MHDGLNKTFVKTIMRGYSLNKVDFQPAELPPKKKGNSNKRATKEKNSYDIRDMFRGKIPQKKPKHGDKQPEKKSDIVIID